MRSKFLCLATAGLAATAFVAACAEPSMDITEVAVSDDLDGSVLLAEWTGPYSGVPAFDGRCVAMVTGASTRAMGVSD